MSERMRGEGQRTGSTPPIPVHIPSAQELYNEEKTTLGGESIDSIRRQIARMPQAQSRELLQTLEVGLATARLEVISHDTRYASLAERNRAIAELGKHTYEVSLDIGFDELREIATGLLSDGLGTWDRAARAIEGIRTARRVRGVKRV